MQVKDMDERYIATLDLGTSNLALSVSKVDGHDIQLLYYRQTPSDGVRYGAVFNPTRAAFALGDALRQANDELGIKINQLVIGMPRYPIRQETCPGKIGRSNPDSCIEEEEVENLKSMALDSYPLDNPQKETIYGAIAQSFCTDDMIQGKQDDVIGMPSETLEGIFKLFIGTKRAIDNVDIMLNKTDVALAKNYFMPEITAKAVLTGQEMDNGVALIEMGAGVTSLSIFSEGIFRFYSSIPFGGKSITMDIKHECGLTEELAENIKLAYGACMPDRLLNMSEKIIRVTGFENGSEQQIPVKYLSEIITARQKEIVNAMLFEIQRSGYADRLRGGVVICGGAAQMANLSTMIMEMSGYGVRVGYPRTKLFSTNGNFGSFDNSAAIATAGMIVAAGQNPYINCIGDVYITKKKEVKEDETVFDSPTEDDIKEIKEREKKIKEIEKKKKKEKEQKEKEKKESISWGNKAIDKMGHMLGSLFDNME